MAAWIVWEQMALAGREVFVFKFEQDSMSGFVHEIELSQVNSNSETFWEPWVDEGPLCPPGVCMGPLRRWQG